ncbi:MAG TPA: hypothetical protein VL528_10780 [Oxalicibacterium sp.]|jgi:hypothetical protein|nr:hypothetical protein [Oxalicibacterium sp.]
MREIDEEHYQLALKDGFVDQRAHTFDEGIDRGMAYRYSKQQKEPT